MKTIKAIKIDIANKTITLVEVEPTLEAFYKHIDTDIIEGVRLDEKNTMYVDECGLLREPQKDDFIYTSSRGVSVRLVGNALICAADDEGEWVDTTMELDTVKQRVQWQQ